MKKVKPIKAVKIKKSSQQVKKLSDEEEARQTYLDNKDVIMEQFSSYLEEVKRDKPSVGGKIMGKDFQQLYALAIFYSIVDQEEYIEYTEKYKPSYVDLKEEQESLKLMIKEAKKIFGKEYKTWHENEKKNRLKLTSSYKK